MKKIIILILLTIIAAGFILVTLFRISRQELTTVGFLFPDSMYDQTWGTEGYKGMLGIVQKYDTAFFSKQHINTKPAIRQAVQEMADRNVTLLYGQGIEYTKVFNEVADDYPKIHFVVFNGRSKAENVTAVNIDGYAMGYFGGMIAAHESKTGHIGIVGSFRTQPEIQEFIKGAQFEDKNIKIIAHYLETFSYDPRGTALAKDLIDNEQVDVIFPAADGVNADIMAELKNKDVSTVGFIVDQSRYGPNVLTSVQLNLSRAYQQLADDYVEGTLKGGALFLGIDEQMTTLGPLSYHIDKSYRKHITELYRHYESTHQLPDGHRPPKVHDELYQRTLQ